MLQKLQMLHDVIKSNPYREDAFAYDSFKEGYFRTLQMLSDCFFEWCKSHRLSSNPIGRISPNFFHDLNHCISVCRHAQYGTARYNHAETMIEISLSLIHTYLDTGKVEKYPTKIGDDIVWNIWQQEENAYRREQNNGAKQS